MSRDRLERELERRLRELEPPEAFEQRLLAVSREWARGSARRPRRRRHRRAITLVAIGLALGGATAGAITVLDPFDDGLSVPAGDPVAEEIARSPLLVSAPWLRQPEGAQRIDAVGAQPSLIFPEGTSYRGALEALFASVVERGRLPARASIGKPLPAGVVWTEGGGDSPPALDLRAPWGYTVPGGRIRTPSYTLAGSLNPAQVSGIVQALEAGQPLGAPLPQGVRVDVPSLISCQLGGPDRMPCGLR